VSSLGSIVVAPMTVRIWRIDFRTASRKARLAFSIRCQRSATCTVRRFWAEADIRRIEERFNRMNSDLSRLAARDYKLGQGKPK
jgi:hypothetical protein